ncbi:MAG: FAD-binding protein [Candidatus Thermoplasmatota archaeon]|nr:FAD-binding protein [Candidatus Thermoplasmatota archaeon]
MKVLVFAKQIPDVNRIDYDPKTNRIIRENVPLSMNSFDRKAVEEAIRLKEKHGYEIMVATMGPPQSKDILNEALRMGMDRAFLISDRKFGGSDTLATSRILSAFVKIVSPDIILMGKYSLDGETSQVPPEVAVFTGYSFKSSISKIEVEDSRKTLIVEHENERGLSKIRIPIPAVLSVSEKINRARAIKQDTPDMSERIEIYDSVKLGIDLVGSEYSPTVVTGTRKIESFRNVEMLDLNAEVYDKVSRIIRENREVKSGVDLIVLKDPGDKSDTILGVAINDKRTAGEISSKISQLANEHNLRATVFGNIDPEEESGISCHDYYYLDTGSNEEFEEGLTEFIKLKKPRYVIFPSTVDGREIAGTIAARLELGLTADCVDLEIKDGKLIQYKPAFGGGIVASIYSKTDPQMTTVRPGMFKALKPENPPKVIDVRNTFRSRNEVLENTPVPSEYMPLGSSNLVIGVGRGLKKREMLKEILGLAGMLDAAVGGTRPIVDMGFMPRQQQIGLTGSSISPGVYIALGVSGHANHVVGIRYCSKILAVNSDPSAEIFKFADYGIIADIQDFIHRFMNYLNESGPGRPGS